MQSLNNKNNIKKIIFNKHYLMFILIIFGLVIPYTSFFISLNYNKIQIKKQIKKSIIAGIKKEELVFLKFSNKETQTILKWKHSKEFEFENQMYDIVSFEIKTDSIFYWCWLDHAETALNKKLNLLTLFALGNSKQNKENHKLISFFYHNLICVDNFNYNANLLKINNLFFEYNVNFYNFKPYPIFPPPKFC